MVMLLRSSSARPLSAPLTLVAARLCSPRLCWPNGCLTVLGKTTKENPTDTNRNSQKQQQQQQQQQQQSKQQQQQTAGAGVEERTETKGQKISSPRDRGSFLAHPHRHLRCVAL